MRSPTPPCRWRAIAACAWLAAGLAAGPAAAAGTGADVVDGAAAPPPVVAALGSPRLAGEGEMRWFGLRVYGARLWVAGPVPRATGLAGAPFALELRYGTALRGEAIAERSAQEIGRLGYGDAAARERWRAAMRRLFPDVARGDRIAGVHEPGRGARFYLNDRPLGGVDDPGFATAFFAIWLDERTVAPALRDALTRGLDAPGAGR